MWSRSERQNAVVQAGEVEGLTRQPAHEMASGMRQLPGTLRFQVVQESHTSGLTPAARLWVAGEARVMRKGAPTPGTSENPENPLMDGVS